MEDYRVKVRDRAGTERYIIVSADGEGDARLKTLPGDRRLCRNSYVELARVPGYDRQIVSVEEV